MRKKATIAPVSYRFAFWRKLSDQSENIWLSCGALVFVTLLVYSSVLKNGFFYIDDANFITANPLVTGAESGGIFRMLHPASHADLLLYIPLTIFSWSMTWWMGGGSAAWFHVTDVLLHSANTLVLFWIIDRLTGQRKAAWIAGLFFAVHPLNVEAVVWASQRKDLLAAFFALLSFALYIKYLEEERRHTWIVASIAAYALGLLCKISIAPLPLVLGIFDLIILRGQPRQWLREKTYYFLFAAPVIAIGLHVGQTVLTPADLQILPFLGAKSVAVLFALFFVPLHLSALRWENGGVMLFDADILFSLVVVLGLIVAMFIFLRHRARFGLAAFGIAWFLLFLLPTFPSAMKLGMLYYTSEKYAYLPMAGLLLASVVHVTDVMGIYASRLPCFQRSVTAVIVIALFFFVMQTSTYIPAWQNMEKYSHYVLQSDPTNPYALTNLGVSAEQSGDMTQAKEYYARALAADPTNALSALNSASLAFRQGNDAEMIHDLRKMEASLIARQIRGDIRLRRLLAGVAQEVLFSREPALALALLQKIDTMAPGDPVVQAALGAVVGAMN